MISVFIFEVGSVVCGVAPNNLALVCGPSLVRVALAYR